MPAGTPILDPSSVDLNRVLYQREEIRRWVPQRHEFEMLHGIVHLDPEKAIGAAYRDLTPDEFWVRGHIPGRPLFPGVLMIETAAQLCGFVFCRIQDDDRFFGFGGVDAVRFRGTVVPGDRLLVMARAVKIRKRIGVFETQSFVGDQLVYEGVITGMVIPEEQQPEQVLTDQRSAGRP